MYILFILIIFAICIALRIYLGKLFVSLMKKFSLTGSAVSSSGLYDASAVNQINFYLSLEYPKALHFMTEFKNIYTNLYLKFAIFTIFVLITHFTDSLIPCFIYGSIFMAKDFFVFFERTQMFKQVRATADTYEKRFMYKIVKKAYSVTLPFSLLTIILCYLVYLFN